jgi:[NiFe] hydrogenase assembly HybE family chaperone
MSDARFLPDPAPCLVAAFRAAAARMAGLPIVNSALDVEAVGFAPWEGHWLGVMVTPWSMNLVLAPRDPACWRPLGLGVKRRYRFPAGTFEFVGAFDAAAGEHQACSLMSPVLHLADPATARLVAALARDALLDPANADPAPDDAQPGPLARIQAALTAPLTRVDLLHGRAPGGASVDRG